MDFIDAHVLVSCVSQKLSEPAPARVLYRSVWFIKVRTLLEVRKADWFILSALHGVVSPDTPIARYEKTLNAARVGERRIWAENVHRQLAPVLMSRRRVALASGLHEPVIDPPSPCWLGLNSRRDKVRGSGLWNQRHVNDNYMPRFLDVLEAAIERVPLGPASRQ